MFFIGKVIALITQPLAWVAALLLLGLVRSRPGRGGRGRGLLWGALFLLAALGWQPLPDLILRRLEAQYPELPLQADLRSYVGMVVLGGALEEGYIAQSHQQPQLRDGAERMLASATALQRNPHLRLLFTGGEGTLFGQGPSEAVRARAFYDSLGVSSARVTYEDASRTTFENAVLSAQLSGVDRSQPWLLVTSAWHMPRAMATFAKAGWTVSAYPVDYRTGDATPWTEYSLREGVTRWQIALHECVGWLSYWLTGRL